jgi:putative SOS response-associated peptidase YedK
LRYNRLTWREIVALYRLSVPATPERNLPARYNICPTQTIDAVIEREGKREMVPMRWGLIPSWWKKSAKEVPSTFNARAEMVATKPMFLPEPRNCLLMEAERRIKNGRREGGPAGGLLSSTRAGLWGAKCPCPVCRIDSLT